MSSDQNPPDSFDFGIDHADDYLDALREQTIEIDIERGLSQHRALVAGTAAAAAGFTLAQATSAGAATAKNTAVAKGATGFWGTLSAKFGIAGAGVGTVAVSAVALQMGLHAPTVSSSLPVDSTDIPRHAEATAAPSLESLQLPQSVPERPAAAALPSTKAASSTPAERQDPIARELELVRRARVLLDQDPSAALELLRRADIEIRAGYLKSERDALKILCLFRLGKDSTAQKLTQEYLKQNPRGPMAVALREALETSTTKGTPIP